MPASNTLNVNSILNRVAVEVGLDSVSDPWGSTAQHFVQLKTLLQSACEELTMAHPWEFLVRENVTTVLAGDDNEYDLPNDFQKIIEQTGWNRTTDEPLVGPLSAQEWQTIKSANIQPVLRYCFRIYGAKWHVFPDPPEEDTVLSWEYISQNFATDVSGTTEKATLTAADDIILFDRTLIIRYLKLLWLQAKGFDTTAAQQSLDQAFNFLIGKDKGGRILNAGSGRGYKYIDGTNLPLTGYGLT